MPAIRINGRPVGFLSERQLLRKWEAEGKMMVPLHHAVFKSDTINRGR